MLEKGDISKVRCCKSVAGGYWGYWWLSSGQRMVEQAEIALEH